MLERQPPEIFSLERAFYDSWALGEAHRVAPCVQEAVTACAGRQFAQAFVGYRRGGSCPAIFSVVARCTVHIVLPLVAVPASCSRVLAEFRLLCVYFANDRLKLSGEPFVPDGVFQELFHRKSFGARLYFKPVLEFCQTL